MDFAHAPRDAAAGHAAGHSEAADGSTVPNYTYVFKFEKEFEHIEVKGWMVDNWWTVCSYASG